MPGQNDVRKKDMTDTSKVLGDDTVETGVSVLTEEEISFVSGAQIAANGHLTINDPGIIARLTPIATDSQTAAFGPISPIVRPVVSPVGPVGTGVVTGGIRVRF
jgi:hypothetical protein